MVYVVGVSSGAFRVAEAREKPELIGLFKKAQSSIYKGVQFIQLDLESISEFEEPNLKEKLERDIKEKLGVSYGIHSETRAFGIEVAELDSAIETDYKFGHERLGSILEKSGDLGSKYVLIHSSESEPFLFLERHLQPCALVDFWGRPFTKFLEENGWLLDWMFEKGKFMWVEIIGITLDEYLKREVEEFVAIELERWRREYITIRAREPTEEEINRYREEMGKIAEERVRMRLRRHFLDFVVSRSLHYGPERFAYYHVAKWMEKNKDPLWTKMIDATINFFAERDGKKREEWLSEQRIKELTIDDENFRKLSYLWVPSVSAKYIWGHLMQDKNPEKLYPDFKPILKKYNLPLLLETPMAHPGVEEWLRLPNPVQFYYLMKEVGPEYLQIALDLEHMLSIRLAPELVIKHLPEDAGKYIKVIHAGWPATIAPAHLPILLGSEQQVYLYKMYYLLREKGFGLDPSIDHYIVFERGAPETFIESIDSLRKIVKFLEKGTKPEDLPLEFYGIAPKEVAAVERQLVSIREYAYEPLKGLITVPEAEHTFLGRAAVEKGKAEEWKKEKYK
ncbi:MAG: hypothetical protein QMD14_01985 [Candidatus Aenigmarchaeota archaeon]|nr:hypothetical protein [Candidatus Aenigmarchaeota archaeon]